MILQLVAHLALIAAITAAAAHLVARVTPGGERPPSERKPPPYIGCHRRRGWSW